MLILKKCVYFSGRIVSTVCSTNREQLKNMKHHLHGEVRWREHQGLDHSPLSTGKRSLATSCEGSSPPADAEQRHVMLQDSDSRKGDAAEMLSEGPWELRVHTRRPTNASELKMLQEEECSKISPGCPADVVQSYWKHSFQVTSAKGGSPRSPNILYFSPQYCKCFMGVFSKDLKNYDCLTVISLSTFCLSVIVTYVKIRSHLWQINGKVRIPEDSHYSLVGLFCVWGTTSELYKDAHSVLNEMSSSSRAFLQHLPHAPFDKLIFETIIRFKPVLHRNSSTHSSTSSCHRSVH